MIVCNKHEQHVAKYMVNFANWNTCKENQFMSQWESSAYACTTVDLIHIAECVETCWQRLRLNFWSSKPDDLYMLVSRT